jgi:hypothetical protein
MVNGYGLLAINYLPFSKTFVSSFSEMAVLSSLCQGIPLGQSFYIKPISFLKPYRFSQKGFPLSQVYRTKQERMENVRGRMEDVHTPILVLKSCCYFP